MSARRLSPSDIAAWRRVRRTAIAAYTDEQLAAALDRSGGLAPLTFGHLADYRAALHEARKVRGFTVVRPGADGGQHVLFRAPARGNA